MRGESAVAAAGADHDRRTGVVVRRREEWRQGGDVTRRLAKRAGCTVRPKRHLLALRNRTECQAKRHENGDRSFHVN